MPKNPSDPLIKELREMRKLKLVQLYQKPGKLFWINFVIGVARGLGTLAGVSIFLALFVYVLSYLQWVPFLGDFITEIISYIEAVKPSR